MTDANWHHRLNSNVRSLCRYNLADFRVLMCWLHHQNRIANVIFLLLFLVSSYRPFIAFDYWFTLLSYQLCQHPPDISWQLFCCGFKADISCRFCCFNERTVVLGCFPVCIYRCRIVLLRDCCIWSLWRTVGLWSMNSFSKTSIQKWAPPNPFLS